MSNVIKITTGIDSVNPGSLRYAITQAGTFDTPVKIIITKCVKLINLTLGMIEIPGNSITLVNEAGHDVTITSNSTASMFTLPSGTTPTSFKVDGGHHKIIITGGNSGANGGTFYIGFSGNSLILINTIIQNSQTLNAGGAIFTEGVVIMESSVIKNCTAGEQGGAIWSALGLTMKKSQIKKNTVSNINSSAAGAGVFIDNGNTFVSDHSCISYNTCASTSSAGGAAGGICSMNGSIYITNHSSVNHNKAFNAGGIQQGVGNVSVTKHSEVSNNQSFSPNIAAGGGGITITLGTVLISQSEVCGNKTIGMYSGGIVSLVGDVIIQDGSKINYNSNAGPGGGIACNVNSSVVVSGKSEVSHNIGSSMGGGIVNFSLQAGLISISDSIVKGNSLTNAMTIAETLGATLTVLTEQTVYMTAQADFVGGAGGQALVAALPAILTEAGLVSTALAALPGTINGINTANLLAGGGIASILLTSVTLTNSAICENNSPVITSTTNVPITSIGGGVFCLNAPLVADDTRIECNLSNGAGGGVYVGLGLSGHDTIIKGNRVKNILRTSAQDGGGVFNDVNSTSTLIDSEITENKTSSNGGGLANYGVMNLISTKVKNNLACVSNNEIYSTGTIVYV